MAIKNYYPQFPVIPYQLTIISMDKVVAFAKTLIGTYPLEVVKIGYIIFRNESGNGNHGVVENYIGLQSDCGIWKGLDLTNVIGTCDKIDSGGSMRGFICFNSLGYETCFDFLCSKIEQRDMYIGAFNVTTVEDVELLYEKKWVGNPATPSNQLVDAFKNMYKQATELLA